MSPLLYLRGLTVRQPYKALLSLGFFASVLFVLFRLFMSDDDFLTAGVLGDSSERQALCASHGFTPFPAPASGPSRRKVYDITMVNTELDWLEIRLDALYDAVDVFIIVESPRTFHGQAKPMHVRDNWHRFARFHDKMLYHELEFPASFRPRRTWDIESLQRDAGFEQVFPRLIGGDGGRGDDIEYEIDGGGGGSSNRNGNHSRPLDRSPRLGDVLVVADVDEIPRPETLRVLRACNFPRRLTIASRFYYYAFEFESRGPEWHHPQATYYDGLAATLRPDDLRAGRGGSPLARWRDSARYPNASWHCSSCFDSVAHFLDKMASFSHAWMNGAQYRDRDRIADAVRQGRDLWGRRGSRFDRIVANPDLPPLVRDDDRFRYMRDRSGRSAGLKDYP